MHRENRSVDELAYQLWQARGCPHGTAEKDWLDAERQLRTAPPTRESLTSNAKNPAVSGQRSQAVGDSLKATFPASVPPATQGPDQPPTNAEAKSKAAGVSRKESNRRSARAPKKGDASSTDQRK